MHLPYLALSCRLSDSLPLYVSYLITFLLSLCTFSLSYLPPSIISIFLTPLMSIPLLIPSGSVRYYIRVLLSIRQIIICRIWWLQLLRLGCVGRHWQALLSIARYSLSHDHGSYWLLFCLTTFMRFQDLDVTLSLIKGVNADCTLMVVLLSFTPPMPLPLSASASASASV